MKQQRYLGANVDANINLTLDGCSDLPTYRNDQSRTITTRWELTFVERLRVLFGGSIWLSVMGRTHPPVRLDTTVPIDLLKSEEELYSETELW